MVKKIVCILLCQFLFSVSLAYPVSRLMGPAQPSYLTHYANRMLSWYEKEFLVPTGLEFTFAHELWPLCLESMTNWGYEVLPDFLQRGFWFAHEIEGDRATHRQFFCRVNVGKPDLLKKLTSLLKEQGVTVAIPRSGFWGVYWDGDQQQLELRWLVEKSEAADVVRGMGMTGKYNQLMVARKTDFEAGFSRDSASKWLLHRVFKNGKEIDFGLTAVFAKSTDQLQKGLTYSLPVLAWSKSIYVHASTKIYVQLREVNLLFYPVVGRDIAFKHLNEFGQYSLFVSWQKGERMQLVYP